MPAAADVSPDHIAEGRSELRYEDIAQDGRLMLAAMPTALGGVVWRKLLASHPLTTELRHQGVIPILTRVWVHGTDASIPVYRPMEARGGYQLAHRRVDGEVERLFLNMWVDCYGTSGRTYPPQPANAGERVAVGRVFAEHTFTRLFAPAGQRKVVELRATGLEPVPAAEYAWSPPDTAMALPEGATPLDEALVVDPTPIAFGLCHTDSNQHVNSLMYPQLFEEACLRRFAVLGRPTTLLARGSEIAYRKPCFAGQTVRIALQAFELDGQLGAAGCFVGEEAAAAPESIPASRPFCFVRMLFS